MWQCFYKQSNFGRKAAAMPGQYVHLADTQRTVGVQSGFKKTLPFP